MKITVDQWAARNYDPAPTPWVLGQWRRAGQIHPAPERVGREWYVPEDAQRVTFDSPRVSLVQRIKNAA
jgi:hypothetical protein